MWTKHILFLVGALSMCQVFSQDIYVAELMVESNVTLTSASILASWNSSTSLNVDGTTVTISSSELVAECLVVGEEYSCNCSTGYAWSDEVCYNYSCCTEAPCLKNVSQAASICVEKFNVIINGSVQLTSGSWTSVQTTMLEKGLRMMNGVGSLNITAPSSLQPPIAEFEMLVYVRLDQVKFQQILNGLTANLSSAPIYVDTKQMVHISGGSTQVKYEGQIDLTCKMKEPTGSAGWNLSRPFERFSVSKGSLTIISTDCVNEEYKSCLTLNVTKATGAWTGIYECGFTYGTIRHTASVPIKVVLLPDVITMKFSPLIVDCSTGIPSVTVTATIPKSDESYTYFWKYNGGEITGSAINNQSFEVKHNLNCVYKDRQIVNITFKNSISQEKSAHVEIPVFRETAIFCKEETLNDEKWLKTPGGVTLFNQTCPPGRVGYKSRTCAQDGKWQEVFSKCISEELSKVTDAANKFLTGLGATQEVAKDIFEGVKNSSSLSSNGSADIADIGASIGIIGLMANASNNIDLDEDVLPDLIDAASNMVNSNWSEVNDTIRQDMSANYLTNVEDLVKNIKINTSEGFNSTNLELKFCSSDDCSMSVFGIDVNLNKTNGTMKTMGVKNLMEKLKNNNFPGKNRSSILLSATLVGNTDSDVKIKMFFPDEQPTATERLCVFWDTRNKDWSSEGCIANITEDNQTLCECNHLTSFSVLMSKSGDFKDSSILDMITNIGLGVSVFSLLIFLFVESLVWSAVTKSNLSHFRHTAVVNIAVFRLLADCSFLASTDPKKLSDTLCFTFTVCKHLFYLAMFCWMLCLSVMLVHQLIFVFSPVRKRVFMYLSSILGYVLPIALVGTSYVYYKYKEQDYYSTKTCWLTYDRLLEGSIHAFLLPVGTILLSNLFSMVVVIVTLVKTSVPDSSKSDDKETAKSILKVIVFLAPVFGVTWIIGFALLMLEKGPLYDVFEYAFTILNSFQGLFILLTGCVGEQKVRQEVIRIIMVKTGRDTDSAKKLTNSSSTLYTKDK